MSYHNEFNNGGFFDIRQLDQRDQNKANADGTEHRDKNKSMWLSQAKKSGNLSEDLQIVPYLIQAQL